MNLHAQKEVIIVQEESEKDFNLLVIDDDQDMRDSLKDILEVELPNANVLDAANAKDAMVLAKQYPISIALVDIKLGRSNGLELVQPIKLANEHAACIMMTAFREAEYAVEAVQQGADDYLFKPIDPHKLFKTIKRFLRRLELEREKREAEKRFKAIFEQNFQLVFILTAEGRIVDVNQVALETMGAKKREIVNQFFEEIGWWGLFDHAKTVLEFALSSARNGEPFQGELKGQTPEGEPLYYNISLKPVAISRSDQLIVAECRCITDQRIAENELIEAKQQLEDRVKERTKELESAKEAAEQANRAKTQFLSQISHELRTPLNAILGFAQILNMDDSIAKLSSEQQEYINEIDSAGMRLLALIDALLTMTQIESDTFTVDCQELDISVLVKNAIEKLQQQAKDKGITIHPPQNSTGLRVKADKRFLGEIIIGIISNAIEYNKPGGEINIEIKPGETGNVVFKVKDTGIGIPKNVQHRVFMPFDRLDRVSHVDGAGITLALAKKLVELQQGRIGFESEENVGSTFWLELRPVD